MPELDSRDRVLQDPVLREAVVESLDYMLRFGLDDETMRGILQVIEERVAVDPAIQSDQGIVHCIAALASATAVETLRTRSLPEVRL